ncbi:hypothetical protein BX616_009702 [Lobosporangium transversale]|uniref:Uncharacterized protein n=1 Tax=Lobosporangium transversale TaxID=64571 RepID=A0A1Y2GYN7_9FUNG|nr:hypothetical protein BCR41DRAFT_347009 [Lobosporangium transversale]KAF9913717.1 hypothetical protein BX616_009702 [Lobosporangium transversale]ORZ26881.1 hypothetical protein BCR41DRAFT_347009 [Lobosporangium transversale]|eukprot:XP_021884628.1 hypothetical protein BCR41DRAFT_347009 [Lobosporangium transversale]
MPTTRAKRTTFPDDSLTSLIPNQRQTTRRTQKTMAAKENDLHGGRDEPEVVEAGPAAVHDLTPDSESLKVSPSQTTTSTRATRAARRGGKDRARVSTTADLSMADTTTAATDEVEKPRWQRFDTIVIPDRTLRSSKPLTKGKPGVDNWDQQAVSSDTQLDTVSSVVPLHDTKTTIRDNWQDNDKGHRHWDEKNDEDNSSLFSRLSLTPPPPPLLFDLEDEIGTSEKIDNKVTQWVPSVFSSSLPTSTHSGRNVPGLTLADLEPLESGHNSNNNINNNAHQLMNIDPESEALCDKDAEKEDDPFGFAKVDRLLQRRDGIQSKLLTINERDTTTSGNAMKQSNEEPLQNRNNINSDGFIYRLKQSAVDRTATKKRGYTKDKIDIKGKGKAVDQPDLSMISTASYSYGSDISDAMNKDIQMACQLSLGLDVTQDEGCSYKTERMTLSSEATSVRDNQDLQNKMPGWTSVSPINPSSPIEQLEDKESSDNINRKDLGTSVPAPSTPKKVKNKIFMPLDISSSPELSPFIMESSPPRKPEAGAPSSLEPSSVPVKGARPQQRTKTFLLTEQLEAMLPRPRRKQKANSWRSTRNKSDHKMDSEDEASSSEEPSSGAEEKAAPRRGIPTKRATALSTRLASAPNKKRRVQAESETSTSIAKRNQHPSKSSAASMTMNLKDSKGKEKGKQAKKDKGGWTESQIKTQQDRIKYFQQLDNFELEVETY